MISAKIHSEDKIQTPGRCYFIFCIVLFLFYGFLKTYYVLHGNQTNLKSASVLIVVIAEPSRFNESYKYLIEIFCEKKLGVAWDSTVANKRRDGITAIDEM